MAESQEYQTLLNSRKSRKTSRKSPPIHGQEELLRALAEEQRQGVSQPRPTQAPQPAPLHKRLESRLTALLKGSFFPLRKGLPQPGRPPLA
jgi:hypothetical protein